MTGLRTELAALVETHGGPDGYVMTYVLRNLLDRHAEADQAPTSGVAQGRESGTEPRSAVPGGRQQPSELVPDTAPLEKGGAGPTAARPAPPLAAQSMDDLSGWTRTTCETADLLRTCPQLTVFSGLTDPDGTRGPAVVYTEWGLKTGEKPILRDYRWPKDDDRSCAHYVPEAAS
jgi:hypothetical protein